MEVMKPVVMAGIEFDLCRITKLAATNSNSGLSGFKCKKPNWKPFVLKHNQVWKTVALDFASCNPAGIYSENGVWSVQKVHIHNKFCQLCFTRIPIQNGEMVMPLKKFFLFPNEPKAASLVWPAK